jgi:hypothetical protein
MLEGVLQIERGLTVFKALASITLADLELGNIQPLLRNSLRRSLHATSSTEIVLQVTRLLSTKLPY